MAKVLEMPKLSPTMTEGQLAIWHKKEGDAVEVDELLAEVETDKATMEFRAFDKGTLLRILAPAGSTVQLGQPVAILGQPGEDVGALASGAAAATGQAPATTKEGAGPPPAQGAPPPVAPGASATAAASATTGADGRVKASPYVRKVARERDIDLHDVHGSGPGGRIVARDVESLPSAPPPEARPAGVLAAGQRPAPVVKPLSMMRKTIARRLTESKSHVPHFYLRIDADARALVRLREQIQADLAAGATEGTPAPKVSINDLVVKACALALVRVPECNASFTPEAILVHQRVDVSIAVAVPDGLVTPVVRDADRKPLLAIASEVRDLAERARKKQLRPEEMADGTFSVSNLGMFGIDEFAAVINPPEGAILAVGRVREEPVVLGGQVVAGQRLAMTLSCDHRVVDGAIGARFLAELRALVEHPTRVLLG